jgi:glycosyltransferase domain-containing protein
MLTIVIPTFNRELIVLDCMKYWSQKPSINILILDGSENPIKQEKLKNLGSNIAYHHIPKDPFERLSISTSFVSTKYVAMLSDDEFFTDYGISKCIEALEKDSELISCIGHCIGFNFINTSISCFEKYPGFKGYSIMHDSTSDRVSYHMSNYQVSSCYSIYRTEYWVKIIKLPFFCEFDVINPTITPPELPEILIEIITSFYGKSKVIPVVFWIRNLTNISLWKSKKSISVEEWWCSKEFELKKQNQLEKLFKYLGEDTNLDFDYIKKVIIDGFQLYIESSKTILQQNKVRSYYYDLVEVIKSFSPLILLNIYRNIFRRYFNFQKISRIMKENLIDVDENELILIEKIIIKSRQ